MSGTSICSCVLVLAIVGTVAVLLLMDGFSTKQEGYYPGYWGYRVPPWRRRWWWRRRRWGQPLYRYYRPYYYY